MMVSCLCPTYARVPAAQHLLEESVESFLRQDYKDRELLVLNDHPRQQLICTAPNVHVINVSRRFRTLGEKYNAMVGMATGDIICPWEDDDISLPWRISMSIQMLNHYGAAYYTPKKYWFYNDNGLLFDHPMGVGHNCGIYTREAFCLVGGYPCLSGAQDMVMDQKLIDQVVSHGAVEFGDEMLPLTHWFYIMRWHTGSYHLSAPDTDQPGERDDQRDMEGFYQKMANIEVEPGTYTLHPTWHSNYVDDTRMRLPR